MFTNCIAVPFSTQVNLDYQLQHGVSSVMRIKANLQQILLNQDQVFKGEMGLSQGVRS
ncbi:MAG: hypothetical protein IPK86_01415 [Neisseriales bacterium]|nr:MAG: hypothetical protein IPK86_01415 [Neisseriales bacterium]